MSQSVNITITARDQASQTFQAVGKAAGTMSSSVQQSAKGVSVLKGAFAGLASGAAIGFLSDSARAAAEAEVSMARLQSAVEATGKSFDDMQPAIDAAISSAQDLAFDDEAAADALATLTQYTGDTAEAMDLLSLTMDIARGRGVELSTAATAVGKAATGTTGALARMGVVVEEGASAQEALAAAQEKFAGQAEAYSNTSAGAIDRLRTSFGNLQETVGGLAGPLTSIIALLPGLSTGFSALSTAVGGLKGAIGFGGVTAAAGPAAGAIGGVTAAALALAPALIALAPLIVTTGVVMKQAADDAVIWNDRLDQGQLALEGWGPSAKSGAQGLLDFVRVYEGFAEIKQFDYMGNVDGTMAMHDAYGLLTQMTSDQINAILNLLDPTMTLKEQEYLLAEAIEQQALISKMRTVAQLDSADASRAQIGLESVLAAAVEKTGQQLNISMVNYGNLRSGLVGTAAEYGRYVEAVNAAYEAEYGAGSAAARTAEIRNSVRTGIVGTAEEYALYVAAAEKATRTEEEQAAVAEQLEATFTQALIPSIQGVTEGFKAFIVPGEDILDVLSRIGGTVPNVNNAFADMVDSLSDSGAALDDVLGRFKTLDQLGSRSESAVEIAQKVVGDPGVYATVDELLNAGLISLKEYQQLQKDEETIVAANASVQEDLNLMRAKQIDDLAAAQVEYAKYIDTLSRASEEEQTHALYLMDSANAAKVASAYSTAYEASLGNIPKDVATDIIANAAMADPVLLGILEDYGLIEQGAEGTITVTFPDASQQAVNRFEGMFGEGNVALTANGLVVVTDDAGNQSVYDQFGNLVDKSVKATIEVTLSHTSGLDSDTISGILAGRGMSAEDAGVTTTSVAVIIDSDTTAFEKGLTEAKAEADTFANTTYTGTIAANAEPWETTMSEVRADGTTFQEDETYIGTIGGDRIPWDEQLTAAMTGGDTWAGKTFTANIDGNKEFFDAVVASIDKTTVGTVYFEMDGVDSDGDLANGRQLGGTIRSSDVSSVSRVFQTAQRGRTVLVGEAGPELAFMPYGSQIMPSTPSRSRSRSDAANGGMRFYGPVHIHAASPDIAREIERQMQTRAVR